MHIFSNVVVLLLCIIKITALFHCSHERNTNHGMTHRDICVDPNNTHGFYTYSHGQWLVRNDSGVIKKLEYQVENSACHIFHESPTFVEMACNVIHLERMVQCKPPDRKMRLLITGDSLSSAQAGALRAQLGQHHGETCPIFDLEFLRSDEIRLSVPNWVESVCAADIVWLNTGAHFRDVHQLVGLLQPALRAVNASCGISFRTRQKTLLFRSTAEGNPMCNSNDTAFLSFASMQQWEDSVGAIIRGESPRPDHYVAGWHWNQYHALNTVARELITNIFPDALFVDVAPLTRLRPVDESWVVDRHGKKDCLHANPSFGEWNVMSLNHMAATACSRQVSTGQCDYDNARASSHNSSSNGDSSSAFGSSAFGSGAFGSSAFGSSRSGISLYSSLDWEHDWIASRIFNAWLLILVYYATLFIIIVAVGIRIISVASGVQIADENEVSKSLLAVDNVA
jgi:hypothetical protein